MSINSIPANEGGGGMNLPQKFSGDKKSLYIYAKVEKIGHATLFLIRHSSYKDEVLLGRIKDCVLDSIAASARALFDASYRTELSSLCFELSSLIRLAGLASIIDPKSSSLIANELGKVSERIALADEVYALNEKDLGISDETLRQESPLQNIGSLFSARERGIREKELPSQEAQRPRQERTTQGKITDRSQKILAIVRGKGKATIKDISVSFNDCSEKTVQRELSFLVERGLLRKEGERRWSTYFPA